ncbi:hypothetical protein [Alkalicoccobacillus murimartini]|uniref:Uncharacterized protein n=1 Tax=Alkalicoccobacillus murimartini TaxID=171685 RepID=A0ABT9YPS8_9BACI|nr:hypothetical protein [Alkalicoccobacillus murimartini]MDQ0209039.1 hypothetical protein [Alkalicoccobacillus murimartini]
MIVITVILGYATNQFSIILSDRRLNFGENQEYGYDDSKTKLVPYNSGGWTSGAGYADFIDLFQDNLNYTNIRDTDDMINVYQEAYNKSVFSEPNMKKHINRSSLMSSWVGGNENGEILMRLGGFCYDIGENKLFLANHGNIIIFYPGEFLDDKEKVFVFEEKFNLEIGYEHSLVDTILYMLLLFREIKDESKFVSEECDIGVLFLSEENEQILGRFEGRVNEMIEEVKKGNLIKYSTDD